MLRLKDIPLEERKASNIPALKKSLKEWEKKRDAAKQELEKV